MEQTKVISIKCGLANVFILVGKKVIIVDAGLNGSTKTILKALDKHGISQSDVSLILLTHVHPDHCLNLKDLKQTLNVPVAVSAAEAEYLSKGEFSPVVPLNLQGKMLLMTLHSIHAKKGSPVTPEVTFTKELDLNEFGVDAMAFLTPGHTLGTTSIDLKDKRCITGDLIIESPILKKPITPPFAVNKEMLASSVRKILNGKFKHLYTSHGSIWEVDEIKQYVLPKLNSLKG